MNDPKLHGNQAAAVAQVGVRDGACDSCLDRRRTAGFGTDCGWIDHQQINEVGIPVSPTFQRLGGFAWVRWKLPLFELASSTSLCVGKTRLKIEISRPPLEGITRTTRQSDRAVHVIANLGEGKEPPISPDQLARPGKRAVTKIAGIDFRGDKTFIGQVHPHKLRNGRRLAQFLPNLIGISMRSQQREANENQKL